ncbi:MAG: tripartite tricarboxylate transporter TctB family protein [Devosia sp.]|uniref:tripartite tricarboxylate transporter TctB family protein n=1 Tax=Devosia sp. TaxID=1871048 RepID=UPI0024C62D2D|nr:tripartite tricarboxylate transporter TctB family protein [Devosia sp.]UYN98871.1 MAG: tripartite tricarboxylate transporter TctB family protein [Devosia sp.]
MTTEIPTPDDEAPAPGMIKADLLTGLVFIILGVAIFYASWTMDRLEVRRIHPMTIPGLVPGMLSLSLTLCGVILSVRSLRQKAESGWQQLQGALLSGAAGRALVVMGLALLYTLVLIGNMPFWAATGLFVFAFILVFECWLAEPRRPLLTSGLWALGLAIATSGIVTLVFERAFLVRLP